MVKNLPCNSGDTGLIPGQGDLAAVRLSVTPWTAAHQAPPSMGFSRQEYWSGVPLPSPDSLLWHQPTGLNSGMGLLLILGTLWNLSLLSRTVLQISPPPTPRPVVTFFHLTSVKSSKYHKINLVVNGETAPNKMKCKTQRTTENPKRPSSLVLGFYIYQ